MPAGYEIVGGGNLYDGQGGDVTLHVQVKRHERRTDEEAVQQVINMTQTNPQVDGCVMSPADDYTREAESFAEGNGMIFLYKDQICSLVLSNHPSNA